MNKKHLLAAHPELVEGQGKYTAMVRQVPIPSSYGMAIKSLTHHERLLNDLIVGAAAFKSV